MMGGRIKHIAIGHISASGRASGREGERPREPLIHNWLAGILRVTQFGSREPRYHLARGNLVIHLAREDARYHLAREDARPPARCVLSHVFGLARTLALP